MRVCAVIQNSTHASAVTFVLQNVISSKLPNSSTHRSYIDEWTWKLISKVVGVQNVRGICRSRHCWGWDCGTLDHIQGTHRVIDPRGWKYLHLQTWLFMKTETWFRNPIIGLSKSDVFSL